MWLPTIDEIAAQYISLARRLVNDVLGQGSTFSFTLPVAEPPVCRLDPRS
jgi:hypothetical protein